MSRLLTVREICERALRKVGTFSIRDTAADPGELEEARSWLDLVVGHVAASQRTWWLVPATVSFPLTANDITYDLNSVLELDDGDEKVQFPVAANLVNLTTNTSSPLHIERRSKYEDVTVKAQTGIPEAVYIDRQQNPTLYVWPVAVADDLYEIELVYQKFGPDVTRAKNRNPEFVAGIRNSWNLFLVTRVAAECGDGPVRRLPITEIKQWRDDAKALLEALWAYDNDEQTSEPRQTAYTDF